MIVSRTPFRISFFGGGTDYPAWYRQHGGAVVGGTINKYCYLTCRYLPPFFEHRLRVVYSKIENVLTADELQHPAVRECLRYLNITKGVEIHHDGDLPARGGIGSSSAFTVGLLNALYALKGRMVSKQTLAREAIHVEQERLQETVGSQDQVLTAYGGLNHVVFHPNGEFEVQPLCLSRAAVQDFNEHFMLYFTRVHRTASDVAATYVPSLTQQEERMRSIAAMVTESLDILNRGDWTQFGRLLHEYWLLKQGLGEAVSNPSIEEIYQAARSAGALGGKLVGAGGGGYMLLFASPQHHAKIRQNLRGLVHVPFRFEFSGSNIVVFDPGEEYGEDVGQEERGVTTNSCSA